MADRNIAIEYFQSYLPPFIAGQLDFSTLTQLPDVYVSAELQKTMSDIVYSCQRKDRKGKIKVSLLIKHKSYTDKYTPVQIGSYIFSGLQKQIEAKEKQLSLIIPVLLYHGKEKWEYHTLGDLFKNLEPEWKQFLPEFDFVYNNLGNLSDEQVELLHNKFLVASLLALKHTFDKEWLEVNLLRLLSIPEHVPENLLSKFIVYIFESSGFKEEQIIMTIETLPLELKNTVMSTLDIFVEKGKKIGRQEGVNETLFKNTQNMLLKGFAVDTICDILEVTPDYVARVQNEMSK
ncbi:Rpn family recombination-promoting nuclease/putative transposase [Dyadobacter sp. 3J3]|uniref:Rpn family recombination-promoting nuclease/putative transposase n=1 Tax=Dyadobacter sp. 3J3 TaxID=2606600 RepID=UPI00135BC0AF|nr:Rpn family recombination-promoting nuclease/putative transposase [Dyadobacter sp. 3J3]